MGFEFFTGEALNLAVSNAGPLPSIIRMGREAQPLDGSLVEAFRRLGDKEYAQVGIMSKHGDKRDVEALSAVASLNRAAMREGLRRQGCIFVVRTIDGGASIAVYVGNDSDRVDELDRKAAARLANKA